MEELNKPSPEDKDPLKKRYHMIQLALEKLIREKRERIIASMYIRRN